jgi:signal transduction histidine kinase
MQVALISLSILFLVLGHWLIQEPDKNLHNFLYNLDFIPIIMAAMMMGWRASLLATLLILALEAHHLYLNWPNDPTYRLDQLGECASIGIAGVVIGYLSSRARNQNASLARTTAELAAVNRELQDNMERLAKAERMYAVAQLSASLAHEIRNPLESISAAAGILRRGQANPANVAECFDIIHTESQRLNKLLADFLSFARPRAPRCKPTDLTEVMDSVVALARHSNDAGLIDFRCTSVPPLPVVECDPEQLKQVLLNVLMNGIQATRRGILRMTAWAEGESAFISIQDQGPGIPEEQRDRIFEPFFTTKDTGSGLGLPIALKIMEQHGGTLTAANAPEGGLLITLQLPINQKVTA